MDVNQGRFLVNGRSGYILKPAYMRDVTTEFDPITLTRGDWLKHKTLHVMVIIVNTCCRNPVFQDSFLIGHDVYPSTCQQVISAQQLPKVNKKKSSIVDPLVKVEVYGVPADVAEKETSPVENNGTFPFNIYIYCTCACLYCTLLISTQFIKRQM